MTRADALNQVLKNYPQYTAQDAEYQLARCEQNMDGDDYDYGEILKDWFEIVDGKRL